MLGSWVLVVSDSDHPSLCFVSLSSPVLLVHVSGFVFRFAPAPIIYLNICPVSTVIYYAYPLSYRIFFPTFSIF